MGSMACRTCLISNGERACKFDPSTLRCAGGSDTGDTCLSDAQLAAYNAYNTPITFNYPLASGEKQYPGFNVFAGADSRGTLNMGTTAPMNSAGQSFRPDATLLGRFLENSGSGSS